MRDDLLIELGRAMLDIGEGRFRSEHPASGHADADDVLPSMLHEIGERLIARAVELRRERMRKEP